MDPASLIVRVRPPDPLPGSSAPATGRPDAGVPLLMAPPRVDEVLCSFRQRLAAPAHSTSAAAAASAASPADSETPRDAPWRGRGLRDKLSPELLAYIEKSGAARHSCSDLRRTSSYRSLLPLGPADEPARIGGHPRSTSFLSVAPAQPEAALDDSLREVAASFVRRSRLQLVPLAAAGAERAADDEADAQQVSAELWERYNRDVADLSRRARELGAQVASVDHDIDRARAEHDENNRRVQACHGRIYESAEAVREALLAAEREQRSFERLIDETARASSAERSKLAQAENELTALQARTHNLGLARESAETFVRASAMAIEKAREDLRLRAKAAMDAASEPRERLADLKKQNDEIRAKMEGTSRAADTKEDCIAILQRRTDVIQAQIGALSRAEACKRLAVCKSAGPAPEGAGQAAVPQGAVAVVSSNVDCSESLWEVAPQAMALAQETVCRVMRAKCSENGGYEAKSNGESFVMVFRSSLSALLFCVELQEYLVQCDWPDSLLKYRAAAEERGPSGSLLYRGPRVRSSVSFGSTSTVVNTSTGRIDYSGAPVAEAERIVNLAKGGQIFITESAEKDVHLHIDTRKFQVVCRGSYTIKGSNIEDRIFEVVPTVFSERVPNLEELIQRQQQQQESSQKQQGVSASVTKALALLKTAGSRRRQRQKSAATEVDSQEMVLFRLRDTISRKETEIREGKVQIILLQAESKTCQEKLVTLKKEMHFLRKRVVEESADDQDLKDKVSVTMQDRAEVAVALTKAQGNIDHMHGHQVDVASAIVRAHPASEKRLLYQIEGNLKTAADIRTNPEVARLYAVVEDLECKLAVQRQKQNRILDEITALYNKLEQEQLVALRLAMKEEEKQREAIEKNVILRRQLADVENTMTLAAENKEQSQSRCASRQQSQAILASRKGDRSKPSQKAQATEDSGSTEDFVTIPVEGIPDREVFVDDRDPEIDAQLVPNQNAQDDDEVFKEAGRYFPPELLESLSDQADSDSPGVKVTRNDVIRYVREQKIAEAQADSSTPVYFPLVPAIMPTEDAAVVENLKDTAIQCKLAERAAQQTTEQLIKATRDAPLSRSSSLVIVAPQKAPAMPSSPPMSRRQSRQSRERSRLSTAALLESSSLRLRVERAFAMQDGAELPGVQGRSLSASTARPDRSGSPSFAQETAEPAPSRQQTGMPGSRCPTAISMIRRLSTPAKAVSAASLLFGTAGPVENVDIFNTLDVPTRPDRLAVRGGSARKSSSMSQLPTLAPLSARSAPEKDPMLFIPGSSLSRASSALSVGAGALAKRALADSVKISISIADQPSGSAARPLSRSVGDVELDRAPAEDELPSTQGNFGFDAALKMQSLLEEMRMGLSSRCGTGKCSPGEASALPPLQREQAVDRGTAVSRRRHSIPRSTSELSLYRAPGMFRFSLSQLQLFGNMLRGRMVSNRDLVTCGVPARVVFDNPYERTIRHKAVMMAPLLGEACGDNLYSASLRQSEGPQSIQARKSLSMQTLLGVAPVSRYRAWEAFSRDGRESKAKAFYL
eukprot:m51a1_g13957 putative adenylate cyclase (1526) ;mRNA; r:943094-948885